MAKNRKTQNGSGFLPDCEHMHDLHELHLTTAEVMAVVAAATHGVVGGWNDADEVLEEGINAMLNQAGIDCEFSDDGMTLTYNCGEDE